MPFPLDDPTASVGPNDDRRPLIPEPPPVRLLAIDDVTLETPAGQHAALDAFYVGLLRFVRDESELAYKAERFRVVFRVADNPTPRDDYRPTMVLIPHWPEFRSNLEEQGIDHEYQKGLTPGADVLLLRDPAGNYVSVGMLVEMR